jgi:hypothetical protein
MTRRPRLALCLLLLSLAGAGPTTQPSIDAHLAAVKAEYVRQAAALDVAEAKAAGQAERIRQLEQRLAGLRAPLAVGINLDANTDYSTQAAWSNLFLTMAPWGQPDKPWEPNPGLRLTDDGHPLNDAGCYTYAHGYPAGDYAFRMEGSGEPVFGGRARFAGPPSRNGPVVTGRVSLAVAGQVARFRVTGIDPADPPRDFRLIVPGLPADTGKVINPAHADAVRPFNPVRFSVGWQRVNDHKAPVTWAGRVKPGDFLQTGPGGVALEYLAAYANETGRDVWVSVPDTADDDYLERMARLFAERLAPERRVFVEWSNEVWNEGRFPQGMRNFTTAQSNPELTATDPRQKAWQQNAFQSRRVSLAFRKHLGNRALGVYAVQAAWAWNSADRTAPGQAEVGLAYLDEKYGPPADYLHALSVSLYRDAPRNVTAVDEIFAGIDADLADPDRRAKDARHAAAADKYGLRLWAYECAVVSAGRGGNPDPRDVAQTLPAMGGRVTALLSYGHEVGFDGVCYYTFSGRRNGQQEGRYPLAESLLTLDAEPKWLAAKAYAAEAAAANN